MILAIDFDNTIHNPQDREMGKRLGKPLAGAVEGLKRLAETNTLIIHTVWGDPERRPTIAAWLEYFDIPYDEITNIKPQADWYIDDKGYHFTGWPQTLLDIETML